MSSTFTKWYDYNTRDYDPLGQDDPKSHQLKGQLWYHHTSDVVIWVTVDANGKEKYTTFSNPEFDALLRAIEEKP